MNTSQAMKRPHELEQRILALMFDDGFGFDEAEEYTIEYALEIFGRASDTAEMLIERAIRRMRRKCYACPSHSIIH